MDFCQFISPVHVSALTWLIACFFIALDLYLFDKLGKNIFINLIRNCVFHLIHNPTLIICPLGSKTSSIRVLYTLCRFVCWPWGHAESFFLLMLDDTSDGLSVIELVLRVWLLLSNLPHFRITLRMLQAILLPLEIEFPSFAASWACFLGGCLSTSIFETDLVFIKVFCLNSSMWLNSAWPLTLKVRCFLLDTIGVLWPARISIVLKPWLSRYLLGGDILVCVIWNYPLRVLSSSFYRWPWLITLDIIINWVNVFLNHIDIVH